MVFCCDDKCSIKAFTTILWEFTRCFYLTLNPNFNICWLNAHSVLECRYLSVYKVSNSIKNFWWNILNQQRRAGWFLSSTFTNNHHKKVHSVMLFFLKYLTPSLPLAPLTTKQWIVTDSVVGGFNKKTLPPPPFKQKVVWGRLTDIDKLRKVFYYGLKLTISLLMFVWIIQIQIISLFSILTLDLTSVKISFKMKKWKC